MFENVLLNRLKPVIEDQWHHQPSISLPKPSEDFGLPFLEGDGCLEETHSLKTCFPHTTSFIGKVIFRFKVNVSGGGVKLLALTAN